jgi:hypothetical protein
VRELSEVIRDAARYRWLRSQHWDSAPFIVVVDPKKSIKLGHETLSLKRLDAAIDQRIQEDSRNAGID